MRRTYLILYHSGITITNSEKQAYFLKSHFFSGCNVLPYDDQDAAYHDALQHLCAITPPEVKILPVPRMNRVTTVKQIIGQHKTKQNST